MSGKTTLWSPTTGDIALPITPGTIDAVLGSNTPSAATVSTLQVDTGTKTAAATAGAATLNKTSGLITSESITTAAGSDYTLTLTNSAITANSIVLATVQPGTSTTGEPAITSTDPAAGSVVIKVRNIAASAAFNGTIIIGFVALTL